ncbi:type IV toxin-antitoxin system AbiEi family antitoxin domain-containing protein [Streptomyces erythrochromogenes]|uniref:type IV toxin-antitoxin system AbiEi family antitoxin domain-containing protein n=1 Tax=Streptomyces erythrochromogenes TaxID=285574 RepID=UPI0038200A10
MDRSEAIRRLGVIAADQWGLATARQAQAAGLSRVDLTRLIDAYLLQRAMHGVYQLPGGTPTPHLDIKAAWLRLDPGVPAWERPLTGDRAAVVSHASACQLYDIGDIPADNVEISVPRRRTTREPGVILHRAAIDVDEVTLVDGLPTTTVDRTICDLLRARADGGHVGRVLADADQRGMTDTRVLADRVQPHARAYGLPKNASGSDLLNFLAEQAGFTLRDEQLTTAGARAAINTAIQEAVIGHGTVSPGVAAALRAAGNIHYSAIRDLPATRAGEEATRRLLEQIGRQSPAEAYLAAIRSIEPMRAVDTSAWTRAIAHMTADNPTQRIAASIAELGSIEPMRGAVDASAWTRAIAHMTADNPTQRIAASIAELMNSVDPPADLAILSEATELAQRIVQAAAEGPAQLARERIAELTEQLEEFGLARPISNLPRLAPGVEDAGDTELAYGTD